MPYINGACTYPYPYTPYPIGCSYITPYLAAPGVAALYACASCLHSSLAARTTSPHGTKIPNASILQRAFLSSTLCFSCPSNCFSKASIAASLSNPSLALASSTRSTNYGQLLLNLHWSAKKCFFFYAAVNPKVASTSMQNSYQLCYGVPPGGE